MPIKKKGGGGDDSESSRSHRLLPLHISSLNQIIPTKAVRVPVSLDAARKVRFDVVFPAVIGIADWAGKRQDCAAAGLTWDNPWLFPRGQC